MPNRLLQSLVGLYIFSYIQQSVYVYFYLNSSDIWIFDQTTRGMNSVLNVENIYQFPLKSSKPGNPYMSINKLGYHWFE